MLIGEYDYEMDIAVQREEAFKEGIVKTVTKMIQKNFDKILISEITGLSIEEIEELGS